MAQVGKYYQSLAKYKFLWLFVNILGYFLIHVYPRRLIFQVLKLTSKAVAFYCSNFVGKLHGFLLFMAIQFVKVWCKAVHFSKIGRQHEAKWIAKHKMFLCVEKERKATGFPCRLCEFLRQTYNTYFFIQIDRCRNKSQYEI